jgi:hypothetical protein
MSPADAGLPSRVPAAVKTVQDMERQVKLARKRWAEAQQRAKEREDRKRREVEYKPGDQVVLSTVNMRWSADTERSKKLKPRFVGPFTVAKIVNPVAVKLDMPKGVSRLAAEALLDPCWRPEAS